MTTSSNRPRPPADRVGVSDITAPSTAPRSLFLTPGLPQNECVLAEAAFLHGNPTTMGSSQSSTRTPVAGTWGHAPNTARHTPGGLPHQAFPQHVHGRAGFSEGLLGQGLRLAHSCAPGRLADVPVALLWLHSRRPGLLVHRGERPLVIGQGFELQERGGLQSSGGHPAHHTCAVGQLLRPSGKYGAIRSGLCTGQQDAAAKA